MPIHPTALVDPTATIAESADIGPHCIVGADTSIGERTRLIAHVFLEGPLDIGQDNVFFPYSTIGVAPQDLKYHGERTELVIGNDNIFREFVTLNRGTTGGGGRTRIGSNNFFMAYAHVAHDCHVGNNTIFANNATLAGHVEVGDHSTVGAFSAVHQFCRVGEHAFIGGGSICTQDVLPFVKTVGNRPAKTYGINTIGLQRKGFSPETVEALQRAYRILVRSHLKLDEAIHRIESELGYFPEARYFAEFARESKRGIIR